MQEGLRVLRDACSSIDSIAQLTASRLFDNLEDGSVQDFADDTLGSEGLLEAEGTVENLLFQCATSTHFLQNTFADQLPNGLQDG